MSTDWPYDPETGEIVETPKPNIGEYSVTEISHKLKKTLEETFGHVRVRGELSGYRGAHSSGHCYFSIKDEGAKLDAVIWRGNFSKLRAKLQEGLEVIATGKITSYPGKSNYQIVIENIEPAGVGALMALLEERKRKFMAEGLFDAGRKRALPYLPTKIGVVTSPTGAVIRDILHRLSDRFPRHVLVWPVRVQGDTSAAEVAAAIRGFNEMENGPDLLIVARGGGSLEDLWGFNDELVVRAVADSRIPVISAVGHETDTTLIDLVADHRAPTPTAAAERAVPVRADLIAEMASLNARQSRGIARYFDERKTKLRAAARALPKPDEFLALVRQRFYTLGARLSPALKTNVQRHRLQLAQISGKLGFTPIIQRHREMARQLNEIVVRQTRAVTQKLQGLKERLSAEAKLFASLNYKSVLARGFVIVRDMSGTPIRLASAISAGQSLKIEFADDTLEVIAQKKTTQGELF